MRNIYAQHVRRRRQDLAQRIFIKTLMPIMLFDWNHPTLFKIVVGLHFGLQLSYFFGRLTLENVVPDSGRGCTSPADILAGDYTSAARIQVAGSISPGHTGVADYTFVDDQDVARIPSDDPGTFQILFEAIPQHRPLCFQRSASQFATIVHILYNSKNLRKLFTSIATYSNQWVKQISTLVQNLAKRHSTV